MSFPNAWLEQVTHCVLCGSAEADVWLSTTCEEHPGVKFTVLQCRECALRYLTPRPTISQTGNYYSSDYYSYRFNPSHSRRHVLKLKFWRLLGMLPSPSRSNFMQRLIRSTLLGLRGPVAHWTLPAPTRNACFLDLGCGAGDRLEIARDLGWRTYGIDLGIQSLVELTTRGHHGIAANIQRLPLVGQTCLYVNLSHSLEHVHDPIAVLTECGRVLCRGGIVNIVVPNSDAWGMSTYGVYWRGLDIPRHLYHFSPHTLKQTAAAAGLRVLSLETTHNEWVLQQSQVLAGGGPLPTKREQRRLNQDLQGEIISLWCTV